MMLELLPFSTWLGITGLVLDIVGVILLATEVWRSASGNETFLSNHELNIAQSGLGPAPISDDDTRYRRALSRLPPDQREIFNLIDEKIGILEFSEHASHTANVKVLTIATEKRKRIILIGTLSLIVGFSLQIISILTPLLN